LIKKFLPVVYIGLASQFKIRPSGVEPLSLEAALMYDSLVVVSEAVKNLVGKLFSSIAYHE
jgi:hypothetical protein